MIEAQASAMGLRFRIGRNVEVLDPAETADASWADLVREFQGVMGRRGAPPDAAARRLATRPTALATMLLRAGRVDAAICGGSGDWWRHVEDLLPLIERSEGVSRVYAMSCLILQAGALFVCDTHMVTDPTAEQVAEMTLLAAEAVADFGVVPKAALLSHSMFGASRSPSARKMREALTLIRARAPTLEIDGEMHADAALSEAIRARAVPDSKLTGTANLLIMPSLDAANIAFTWSRRRVRGCRSARCCSASRPSPCRDSVHHRARHPQHQLDRDPPRAGGRAAGELMAFLLAGCAALLLLFWLARAFSRASVRSIKVFGAWLLGLGGAAAIALMVLSGRGGFAFVLLPLFGRWRCNGCVAACRAWPGRCRARGRPRRRR